jgi:hypothetical protein
MCGRSRWENRQAFQSKRRRREKEKENLQHSDLALEKRLGFLAGEPSQHGRQRFLLLYSSGTSLHRCPRMLLTSFTRAIACVERKKEKEDECVRKKIGNVEDGRCKSGDRMRHFSSPFLLLFFCCYLRAEAKVSWGGGGGVRQRSV